MSDMARPVLKTYPENSPYTGTAGRSMEDSAPAWPVTPEAAPGAPNVVYIVLDDVGFAQLGCFGGDIETPNIDRLAARGLRYRNFHTTAMCSPTRASLLSGRNSHTTGMGGITDTATGFPGYNARITSHTAFVSEVLAGHGYSTWAIGKWHLTPNEEMDPASTRRRWPLGRGFDRFYGFLGAETNQWAPDLVADNHALPTPDRAGYHLTEDLADRAIDLLHDHRNAAPTRPFFLYFAPGACHAPHHVPDEWRDRYAGRFDDGWDAMRDRIHRRQLDAGLLPPGTGLTARPPWIEEWATIAPNVQRLYARFMEVFAGFLSHTDHHIGRVLNAIETLGELDNTVVVLISDNGASPEGGPHGAFNDHLFFNGVYNELEANLAHIDRLGDPSTNPHYPFGWAVAGNTPFQRWKRETHEGGIADPLIIASPAVPVADRGSIREQYVHVADVTPTVLESIGVRFPDVMNGFVQVPLEGTSFLPTLTTAGAPDRHTTQYYEMLGCRAIYHEGWKAVCYRPLTAHTNYSGAVTGRPIDQDPWELYHVAEDFSECHDLAAAHPEKLGELIDLWFREAERFGVLPVHSVRSPFSERPSTATRRDVYVYRPAPTPLSHNSAADTRHRLHTVVADVDIPPGGAEGVLLSNGGRFGGYSLFVRDNRLTYVYNMMAEATVSVSSSIEITAGRHLLAMRFTPTGVCQGTAELFVDGLAAGSVHIPKTVRAAFSLVGEGLCCGFNGGTAVGDYTAPFPFTGIIHTVAVDVSSEQTVSLMERTTMELERATRSQ
jgi:arylsulfatase A-like enzyme